MSRLSHPKVCGFPAGYFFRKSLFCLYRNHIKAVGCPLLYSCQTLRGRPHKKPPMGSRSAALNADCRAPAAVAKEKGAVHSFMIFRIRFNLLGGWYISTAGRGKTSLSRALSLITAAGFHRQQKGHLPGTHGGTLRGRCPASGVNQPR